MTLGEAGPLVALVDSKQRASKQCRTILAALSKPVITTWPCFTEAMYLCQRVGGWPMQRLLWTYYEQRMIQFYTLADSDPARMTALMAQYSDTPMDLADASLVVAAEGLQLRRIFTLDGHFRAYRIHGRHAFEVVP
ncbi:MAG TPA: PIN domain nuclease [Armatimonadota bacterium]|nr:PIN domain nuclease [Armatimonadota bacterium]